MWSCLGETPFTLASGCISCLSSLRVGIQINVRHEVCYPGHLAGQPCQLCVVCSFLGMFSQHALAAVCYCVMRHRLMPVVTEMHIILNVIALCLWIYWPFGLAVWYHGDR